MNWVVLGISGVLFTLVLMAFGQYMCWWDLPVYRSFIDCKNGLVGKWHSADDGNVVIRSNETGTWTSNDGSKTANFHYDKSSGQMQLDGTTLVYAMWTTDKYQTLYINPSKENPSTSIFTSKLKFTRLIE